MPKSLGQLKEVVNAAGKLLPDHTQIVIRTNRSPQQVFEITECRPTPPTEGNHNSLVNLTFFVRPVENEDDDE